MPDIWAVDEKQAHAWPAEGGSEALRVHLDSDHQRMDGPEVVGAWGGPFNMQREPYALLLWAVQQQL